MRINLLKKIELLPFSFIVADGGARVRGGLNQSDLKNTAV